MVKTSSLTALTRISIQALLQTFCSPAPITIRSGLAHTSTINSSIMKKHIRIFLAAVSCLAILSIFSTCAESQAATEAPVASDAPMEKQEMKEPQKVLRHVVAFSFKEEITPENQTKAIENFMSLKDEIPGILSFEGGEDISVEGFTKDLTHCFVLTFADEAARDAYLPHPGHMRVVKENKPLMSDLLVLDFWGEE